MNWTSANRDEAVFANPDALAPHTNAAHNPVDGTGGHACPGRLLATLERCAVVRALLSASTSLSLYPQQPPERAAAPIGGWSRLPFVLL